MVAVAMELDVYTIYSQNTETYCTISSFSVFDNIRAIRILDVVSYLFL